MDDSNHTYTTYISCGIRTHDISIDIRTNSMRNILDINFINFAPMSDLIINYDTLLRIAYYSSSHYPDEAITQEMFQKTYGTAMGDHYYSKWAHLYKFDVLKMVQYFGRDKYEGHQFLTMLKHKIEQYEQRVGR